jgi:hypothetical protein
MKMTAFSKLAIAAAIALSAASTMARDFAQQASQNHQATEASAGKNNDGAEKGFFEKASDAIHEAQVKKGLVSADSPTLAQSAQSAGKSLSEGASSAASYSTGLLVKASDSIHEAQVKKGLVSADSPTLAQSAQSAGKSVSEGASSAASYGKGLFEKAAQAVHEAQIKKGLIPADPQKLVEVAENSAKPVATSTDAKIAKKTSAPRSSEEKTKQAKKKLGSETKSLSSKAAAIAKDAQPGVGLIKTGVSLGEGLADKLKARKDQKDAKPAAKPLAP